MWFNCKRSTSTLSQYRFLNHVFRYFNPQTQILDCKCQALLWCWAIVFEVLDFRFPPLVCSICCTWYKHWILIIKVVHIFPLVATEICAVNLQTFQWFPWSHIPCGGSLATIWLLYPSGIQDRIVLDKNETVVNSKEKNYPNNKKKKNCCAYQTQRANFWSKWRCGTNLSTNHSQVH